MRRLCRKRFRGVVPESNRAACLPPFGTAETLYLRLSQRIQSSRRLEREAGRNLEVIWLLRQLTPDDKTIADFRKDNGAAIKNVCARFVALCQKMGLLNCASVAIRRQQIQSGQHPRQELHARESRAAAAQLEQSVARYLAQLDTAGRQELSLKPSSTRLSPSTNISTARTGLLSSIQSSRHSGNSVDCSRSAPSMNRFITSHHTLGA